MLLLGVLTLILAIFFTRKDCRNLRNGMLFAFSILFFMITIQMKCFSMSFYESVLWIIEKPNLVIIQIIAILLIYNAILIKKVRSPWLDFFSFIVGVGLLLLIYYHKKIFSANITLIIQMILFYFTVTFIGFCINSIIYWCKPKKKDWDVIIVLGAGLIDGKRVTRLLANRLKKAKTVYDQMEKKPRIIVSGGKGKDEQISEAQAMKEYLLQLGIQEDEIIMEDKSTNTFENMKFSKEIIEKMNENVSRIAFVTNNFHVLRAAYYTKKVGLQAEGISCKTLPYYFPNSYIREYIAIIARYPKIMVGYIIFCLVLCWLV